MAETPRDERYQAYMDAIRRKVCTVCLDQRDDGSCRLAGGRVCAIEAHLPGVVHAILSIESDRMEEYEAAIREQVCRSCSNQDAVGQCAIRERGECALYTYLFLVVDAIQEEKQAAGAPRSAARLR